MAGRIPDHILDDILGRIDIVEIIQASIPLKKSGRNFKACCPFHVEKTPSFMVSPDRQIYHCFGCGESGNAFKFLMRHERLDFLEAVKYLAHKAGVELPQIHQASPHEESLAQQLYAANEAAAAFYSRVLESPAGDAAKKYLSKRGISRETAARFRIGLSPDAWDGLILEARRKNIPLSLLEKAGLVLPKDGGGYYDRFRKRLMFPIQDTKLRVLGFGARSLDDTLPKYINSPETFIYTKGKHLFGLDAAKDGIRDSDCAIVVEGYLDCIVPHQAGCSNVVASLGTALTVEQVRMLKRYTRNVVLVYDGDAAGQNASVRSLDIFVDEDIDVRVATLPRAQDPDTYVRAHGRDGFLKLVSEAPDIFSFKFGVLRAQFPAHTPQAKGKIASGMIETISRVKDEIVKSEYIKKLAGELKVEEDALRRQMRTSAGGAKEARHASPSETHQAHAHPTERLLVKLLLEHQDFVHVVREHLEVGDFKDVALAKVVEMLFDAAERGVAIEPCVLINEMAHAETAKLVCESVFVPQDIPAAAKERLISDCVQRLKSEKVKCLKQRLQKEIQAAQDAGQDSVVQELIEKFHGLIKTR